MSDDEAMDNIEVETDDNDGDGEYHPRGSPLPPAESSVTAKQPRKRGRKPNPNQSIRSAREAARKANHSVIEKKRREKINHALTELRSLVPAEDGVAASSSAKDFKLEVLVRTVSHLKHLITRIDELESVKPARLQPHTSCRRCIEREAMDLRSGLVELPPVSSLLTGLPSPPSSGSLASSPTHTDVPSLHLPRSTISFDRSTGSASDAPQRYPQLEQAAYSLLHMSAEQRTVYTPGTLLGVSPNGRHEGSHLFKILGTSRRES